MAEAKIVLAKLRKLLPTLDMDTATQRSIVAELERQLGVRLDHHKQLIKGEIDRFLTEEEGSGGGEEGEEEEAAAQEPAQKKQKQASGAAAAAGRPPGGHLLALSDKRFVALNSYKGRWQVDVREYYLKEGQLAPGSKGLALAPDQWRALADNMEMLSAALEDRDDSVFVDLGGSRRAGPSNYGGKGSLDLREFYEAGSGELKPGKKGISLKPQEWEILKEGAPAITQQLLVKLGGAWPQAPAQTAGAGPHGGKTAGAGSVPAPTAAAGGSGGKEPAAAAAAGPGGGGGGPAAVELSASRRADVSEFNGKSFVNIRDYYSKDGQWLPGKKGISLPPDQLQQLVSHAEGLGAALRARDTSYEVQLSNKRKASITSFKGTYYVNIREYYKKGEEMLPGQKGISLPPDQWSKLEGALPGLQAALQAAGGH